MSSVQKLGIIGIRSYDPSSIESIEFFKPLTIIWGHNGAGKTTIIECLKCFATGSLPPNCDKGKSFIIDSKITGKPENQGQIKVMFTAINKKILTGIKTFKVVNNAKGISFSTKETLLKIQGNNGEMVSINHTCAEIEKQVPQLFGVSRAVLENVIFCHQEESQWPFGEQATLKNIFDELFDTTKYSKINELLKQQLKTFNKELKDINMKIQYNQIDVISQQKQELVNFLDKMSKEANQLKILKNNYEILQTQNQIKLEQLKKIQENQSQIQLNEYKIQQLQTQIKQKNINGNNYDLNQLHDSKKNIIDLIKSINQEILSHKEVLTDKQNRFIQLKGQIIRNYKYNIIVSKLYRHCYYDLFDFHSKNYLQIMIKYKFINFTKKSFYKKFITLEHSFQKNLQINIIVNKCFLNSKIQGCIKKIFGSFNKQINQLQREQDELQRSLKNSQNLRNDVTKYRQMIINTLEIDVDQYQSEDKINQQVKNLLQESLMKIQQDQIDIKNIHNQQVQEIDKQQQDYNDTINQLKIEMNSQKKQLENNNAEIDNLNQVKDQYNIWEEDINILTQMQKFIEQQQNFNIQLQFDQIKQKKKLETYLKDQIEIQQSKQNETLSMIQSIQQTNKLSFKNIDYEVFDTKYFQEVQKFSSKIEFQLNETDSKKQKIFQELQNLKQRQSHIKSQIQIEYEDSFEETINKIKTSIQECKKKVIIIEYTQNDLQQNLFQKTQTNLKCAFCKSSLDKNQIQILSEQIIQNSSNSKMTQFIKELKDKILDLKKQKQNFIQNKNLFQELENNAQKIVQLQNESKHIEQLYKNQGSYQIILFIQIFTYKNFIIIKQIIQLQFVSKHIQKSNQLSNYFIQIESKQNLIYLSLSLIIAKNLINKLLIFDQLNLIKKFLFKYYQELINIKNELAYHIFMIILESERQIIIKMKLELEKYHDIIQQMIKLQESQKSNHNATLQIISQLNLSQNDIDQALQKNFDVTDIQYQIQQIGKQIIQINKKQFNTKEIQSLIFQTQYKMNLNKPKDINTILQQNNNILKQIGDYEKQIAQKTRFLNENCLLKNKLISDYEDQILKLMKLQSKLSNDSNNFCEKLELLVAICQNDKQNNKFNKKNTDLECEINKIEQSILKLKELIEDKLNRVRLNEIQKSQILDCIEVQDLQSQMKKIQTELQQFYESQQNKEIQQSEQQELQQNLNAALVRFNSQLEKNQIMQENLYQLEQKIENNQKIEEEYLQLKTKEDVLKKMIHDIGIYITSIEQAISIYHITKISQINKILADIWREIYRGIDIKKIQIKRDHDKQDNKNFSYKITYINAKNQELEMKGKCSMGQKVLASIVIRLALAESFSLNCGILALDEPTTNLDSQNVESNIFFMINDNSDDNIEIYNINFIIIFISMTSWWKSVFQDRYPPLGPFHSGSQAYIYSIQPWIITLV